MGSLLSFIIFGANTLNSPISLKIAHAFEKSLVRVNPYGTTTQRMPTTTANTTNHYRKMLAYGYTHFWVKQWEDRTPPEKIIA